MPQPPTPEMRVERARLFATVDTLPKTTPHGDPLLYLSYDDGPSSYTGELARALREYGATATWFFVGSKVAKHGHKPEMWWPQVRAVRDGGNEIGLHTWDHSTLRNMPKDVFLWHMEVTANAIRAALGEPDRVFRLFRPPYGSIDLNTAPWGKELGMKPVMWSIDPKDFNRPSVEEMWGIFYRNVQPGSLVLLHCGGGDRSRTVALTRRILEWALINGVVCSKIDPDDLQGV